MSLYQLINEACRCQKCGALPQDCSCIVRASCRKCGAKQTFQDHPDFLGEKVIVLDECPDCLQKKIDLDDQKSG